MAKKLNVSLKEDIDLINASTLTAKEKELAITAILNQRVQRNENIIDA
jgi:hypothetical protein